MAGKKKTDGKSEQLAAAAVGAGADLVQAQSEPLQTVDMEQAAAAQGVDVVADHQAAFDAAAQLDPSVVEQAHDQVQQALAEGKGDDQGSAMAIGASSEPGANLNSDVLTAEQLPAGVNVAGLTLEGVDASAATLILGVEENQPDWLLGQFDVKAKSPAGFWRCGVQFLHSSPTRVFVVNDKADVPADHDCSVVCCYLTLEEARRVHNEPWLTVVLGSEVLKD